MLALSLCAAHGRDTLYGASPPGCIRRRGWLAKLPSVCFANTRAACLAKVALDCTLSAKSSSPSSSLFATQMRYSLVSLEEVAWRSSCTEVLRSVCKARTAACSRDEAVVGGSYGEEVWNCRSVAFAFMLEFLPLSGKKFKGIRA